MTVVGGGGGLGRRCNMTVLGEGLQKDLFSLDDEEVGPITCSRLKISRLRDLLKQFFFP